MVPAPTEWPFSFKVEVAVSKAPSNPLGLRCGPQPEDDMSDTPTSVITENIANKLKAHPELLKTVNAIFEFNITGDTGGVWTLDVTEESGGVISDGTSDAEKKIVITVADADFMKIIAGTLKTEMAYMSGKLKVKGNPTVAIKLKSLLT